MFYYEPNKGNKKVRSYTLSFSRIDKESNTYKQKAILQYWSDTRNAIEEYKMKEVHIDAHKLLEKINKIDFNKTYTKPNETSDKLYICYNGKQLVIGDLKEIEDVLNDFNFFNLYKISHKHYKYINDMNDYTKLKIALYKKGETLTIEEQVLLDNLFKESNPYNLFQNISYLKNYLNSQEVKK